LPGICDGCSLLNADILHCSKQSKRKDKRRGIPARLVADMLKLAGRWRFFDGLGQHHNFQSGSRLLRQLSFVDIAYMGQSVAIYLIDSYRLFE
jgi:hypothetical protein